LVLKDMGSSDRGAQPFAPQKMAEIVIETFNAPAIFLLAR
jgi:hypothetical protein